MTKLVRWSPFHNSLFDEVDRLFENQTRAVRQEPRSWGVALDVIENEDGYIVKASVPGIDADALEVTLENNVLSLKGETQADEEFENDQYHVRERRSGKFSRSIRFPIDVNGSAVEASYDNGILTLNVPKAEEVKPKRIEVKIN